MNQAEQYQATVDVIRKKHPSDWQPKVAVILGSGLSNLINQLENPISISYQEIPGFPLATVDGHQGNLVTGSIGGNSVLFLQGRSHIYETGNTQAMTHMVRTVKALGCDTLLITNAAGSMREDFRPGEFMLIYDHINFQGINPLIGPNDDSIGPRFPAMDGAYDTALNANISQIATELKTPLHEGIYFAVLGPCYETAAEIRAFRLLGGDVIGMSTVPEVIIATHCQLKVAAISVITNYATGIAKDSHNHQAVIATAQYASESLAKLVSEVLKRN